MTIQELTRASRSYRGYDESYHFTKDQLASFVECARLAPSSVNRQPLKYYLAWEREETEKILALTYWARALPQLTLPHPGKHPTGFVVICQDLAIDKDIARYQKDVGICAQTILLAAAEAGLGGCMIGNFHPGTVRETLSLSEDLRPMLIVALGKPDETIVLTDIPESGSTDYWRDENDVHYVPKRSLEDILLN